MRSAFSMYKMLWVVLKSLRHVMELTKNSTHCLMNCLALERIVCQIEGPVQSNVASCCF
jgi:hypothetical protein